MRFGFLDDYNEGPGIRDQGSEISPHTRHSNNGGISHQSSARSSTIHTWSLIP